MIDRKSEAVTIVVDREGCAGSGNCALLAPAIFGRGPDGGPELLEPHPLPHMTLPAQLAAQSCPAQAIALRPGWHPVP